MKITSHRAAYAWDQSAQSAAVSVGQAGAENAGGVTLRISHKLGSPMQ